MKPYQYIVITSKRQLITFYCPFNRLYTPLYLVMFKDIKIHITYTHSKHIHIHNIHTHIPQTICRNLSPTMTLMCKQCTITSKVHLINTLVSVVIAQFFILLITLSFANIIYIIIIYYQCQIFKYRAKIYLLYYFRSKILNFIIIATIRVPFITVTLYG